MTHVHGATPVIGEPDAGTPSARLIATLGGAGAVAGLLLVLVWRATTPTIEAHRAAVVQRAIADVLRHPPAWDTLYVENGALTAKPIGERKGLERVYQARDAGGAPGAIAIQAGEPGFADMITVMFAMNPADGSLLAMKVLAQKETPGLGDKIVKDTAFVAQFAGTTPPLKAVKAGSRRPPFEVDAITGATISSRTIVKIINTATVRWQLLIAAYRAGAGT